MKRILLIARATLIIGISCTAGQPAIKDPYDLLSLNRHPLSRQEILNAYSDELYRLNSDSSLTHSEKVRSLSALNDARDQLLSIKSETTPLASPGANWNFELKNNTRYPISVSLENNNGPIRLSQSEQFIFSIEAKKSSLPFPHQHVPLIRLSSMPTQLITTLSIKSQDGRLLGRFELDSPASRSFFLVWEGDSLRPQKGSEGSTSSGISLASNIHQTNIKTITLEKR